MTEDIFANLPARQGHFLLESGYHTNVWFNLDALFVNTCDIAPLVTAMAGRMSPYDVDGVCGPLLGGAFLAQAIANELESHFYFTQPAGESGTKGLYRAEYNLPPELQRLVADQRIAVVDDVISAGSSVRATLAALTAAGAKAVVVGALMVLGNTAAEYFSAQGMPLETLAPRDFTLWEPNTCPLCTAGIPLTDPVRTL